MRVLTFSLLALLLNAGVARSQDQYEARFGGWVSSVTMIASDTSKVIKAAPGAGRQLVVTYVACTILTSAAQATNIEETGSANILLKLAASPVANTLYAIGHFVKGLTLTANTALQITPAAAGPSMFCIAEGYVQTNGT